MSEDHDEIVSFSLDFLSQAVEVLGGEHATNDLGVGLVAVQAAILRRLSDSFSLEALSQAVEVLGGEHATNDLGAGLVAVQAAIHRRLSEDDAPAQPRKGNLTSLWLAKHGKETRAMLIEHLSHKLPTSRKVAVIEDHVQTFLCRLVEKDTLASHISEGRSVQPSVLRVWAYQSACTEMRGWGVDASLRKSRGAKTHRDRRADAGLREVVIIQSTDAVIERRYEIENGESVTDLHDPHARSIEDDFISAETRERARALIARKISGAGPRYAMLLDSLMDGEKRSDLAVEAGVSPARIAAMVTKIREVLRNENLLD